MGSLVTLLQAWSWIVVGILLLYAVRHWYFTLNRVSARQRPSYQDLLDSDLPAGLDHHPDAERRSRRNRNF